MLNRARRCSVYDGRGECCGQSLDLELHTRDRSPVGAPDRVTLGEIMTSDVICARPDLEVAAVVTLMIRHHIGCIPVVDDRRHPLGMITKFDIVEHLDAFMRSATNGSPLPADLAARTADELMMPIALTLDENASVAQAAGLMTAEDLHHVIVVNERRLVGIVSTKDITRWIAESGTPTRE